MTQFQVSYFYLLLFLVASVNNILDNLFSFKFRINKITIFQETLRTLVNNYKMDNTYIIFLHNINSKKNCSFILYF